MRVFAFLLLAALAAAGEQGPYPFAVDQDRLTGAPDYSFLNHPITPADRIFVRDGHFYRVGKDLKPNTRDDERVRLFGVNFAFGANFPEPADAARIAKRLRRLGVNLVRLHHMDSSPDANPENARSLLTTGPYPTLNPVSVARLRGLLDAFRAEGIYVNLNLHVGYTFRAAVDKLPAFPDGAPLPNQSKPLHIFYPRMVELQLQYTHDVIGALKLKNDPVLAMLELDNEVSLLQTWGWRQLDKALQGEYKTEWLRQWREFRKANDDAPLEGDQYIAFMADRDKAYLDRMLAAVRAATDNLVPVTGTQMGYGGLLNLETHASMDYQDNHFYVDHYNFPHQPWDSRDWRIRDTSSTGSGLPAVLNMAFSREAGKPLTISEFNQPWPNRQAAELDPILASMAAFQDWDALMHFAYSHGREWGAGPGSFDINGDWTKWPNLGQSAWLFRSGAIAVAKSAIEIPVSHELRMKFTRERKVNTFAPFFGTLGIDPANGIVHRVALTQKEAEPSKLAAPSAPYRADTGELSYDREGKLYLISAPKAAGAIGYFKQASAGGVTFELVPNEHGFATILVTALDEKPLAASGRMLLSTPGYTLSANNKLVHYGDTKDWWTFAPEAGNSHPSAARVASGTVMMERVESFVTLASKAKSLTVYPLDGSGNRLAALPASDVVRGSGGFRIHLQGDGQAPAPWYEIVAK